MKKSIKTFKFTLRVFIVEKDDVSLFFFGYLFIFLNKMILFNRTKTTLSMIITR
jgi:hypothetical protein